MGLIRMKAMMIGRTIVVANLLLGALGGLASATR
jgi:hypothetical protein